MDLERPWAKTGPQTCPAPSLPQGAPDSFSFVAFGGLGAGEWLCIQSPDADQVIKLCPRERPCGVDMCPHLALESRGQSPHTN